MSGTAGNERGMKMAVNPKVYPELVETFERLSRAGEIVPAPKLAACYETFRRRFGPGMLASLDGEVLLSSLKLMSNHDSLAYWLEFKNDDEFPAAFGSIAGGSALKFGIYWNNEASAWFTGSPTNQRAITVAEAIDVAREHRDQLVRGAELIAAMPPTAGDEDYRRLQASLDRSARDVQRTVWGHKYFSLLFPERIFNIHVVQYQQFHLIRLLEIPPSPVGRYVCEGRYVTIASELNIPLHSLMPVLYARNGPPTAHWRIDVGGPGDAQRWDIIRDGRCLALGWPDVGDLASVLGAKSARDRIRERVEANYNSLEAADRSQQLYNLGSWMKEGDLAIVVNGDQVLGAGRIAGPYVYVEGSPFPHRRPLRWLSLEPWRLPRPTSAKRAVDNIDYEHDPASLVAIERHLLDTPAASSPRAPGQEMTVSPVLLPTLTGIPARIQAALERKGQVIVYGPPGTGKTHWALVTAQELAARSHFQAAFEALTLGQRAALLGEGPSAVPIVRFCTFHPGYGYEDFLEGYRPAMVGDRMVFVLRDGIFKQLCADAARRPNLQFFLVIDEINRGDVPRIFGELLTLLEKNKRGMSVVLPLSGDRFSVPDNVSVLGTMNTADRSIALLDTALRRRFGFVEIMPDGRVLDDTVLDGVPLGPWLDALNDRIRAHVGRDARNLQIGHAYLLVAGRPIDDFATFARVLREDLLPLLEEYCYEDYSALEQIMGPGLVDAERQCFREELFGPARRGELIQALLEPSPDIAGSRQAVQAEAEAAAEAGDAEDAGAAETEA